MLQFDRSFFEGETREGFYIEPMMKHAWAAHLEVLQKIDAICEANDIRYFADWGTLLGAVRHQGYIPWDDDMDIGMLRPDLERFRDVMKTIDTDIICLSMYNHPTWGNRATKVLSTESMISDRATLKEYHGFPLAAGVDVFPLDYIPRDLEAREFQIKAIITAADAGARLKEFYDMSPGDAMYKKGEKVVEDILKELDDLCGTDFSVHMPTYQEMVIFTDQLSGLCQEEDADYVGAMHRVTRGQEYFIPKEYYDDVVMMPFENIMIPAPREYDLILRKKYGDDYMTPMNKGAGHDYPYYNILLESYSVVNHDKSKTIKEVIENKSTIYYKKFLDKKPIPKLDDSNNNVISAALCEVLEEVKRICKKLDIPLFAISDTITETVENKGLGDGVTDLHLAIKRENNADFVNCLQEELDPWFDFYSVYMTDGHTDMRTYIVTDNYLCDEEEYRQRFHGCDLVVGVDIAVLDPVDMEEEKDEACMQMLGGILKTAQCMTQESLTDLEKESVAKEWERLTTVKIDTKANQMTEYLRMADRLAGGYGGDSEWLRLSADLQENKNTLLKSEWFTDSVELEFENTTIPIPVGYQEMVKNE